MYRMFIPLRPQTVRADFATELDRLILNYNTQNPSNVMRPRTPFPHWVKGGVKLYMTDEQYNAYLREAGSTAARILERRRGSLNFDNPSERDRKIIEAALPSARKRAKAELWRSFSDDQRREIRQQIIAAR